jgi:hypothetical protein
MPARLITILAACGLAGMLAGCGASTSLLGGSKSETAQIEPPKPATPSERALYVAATVARAQRCGFYFEPEQLRANYLAAETQAGAPPEIMQKVTREFDYTRQSIVTAVAKEEGYCTEGLTREVKAALSRQLAGDFDPPRKRQEINVGWYEHQYKGGKFNGEAVFDKSIKQQQ